MTSTPWVPLGMLEDELVDFLALREGIPNYMSEAVINWILDLKTNSVQSGHSKFLVDFQVNFRKNFGIRNVYTNRESLRKVIIEKLNSNDLAQLLDFVLSDLLYTTDAIEKIRDILTAGGSSWAVGKRNGRNGLVARLPSSVVDTVAHVTSTSDQAGSKLAEAWDKAFGANPQPSDAYSAAVRAVEILTSPLVSPRNTKSTLGTDIRDLRNQQDKWQFSLRPKSGSGDITEFINILDLLWSSQLDRHGSPNYSDATVQESQAAVLLASTIIGWLSKNMLTRQDHT